MNDTKKTLRDKIVAEKVVAVMQEVKSIQKKGKNTYAKYDYATADGRVRCSAAHHGQARAVDQVQDQKGKDVYSPEGGVPDPACQNEVRR